MSRLPKRLVSSAAVGTDIRDFHLDAGTPLGDLVSHIDELQAPTRVLATIGAIVLQEKIAWVPRLDHRPFLEPCPIDNRPILGRRAMRYLTLMINGLHTPALSEWVAEVTRRNLRAPEEMLTMLLDTGKSRKDLRDLILPLLGERGRWLASQVTNRGWNWCIPDDAENIWTHGSPDQRLALFRLLRKQAPDRARELLEQTWAQEKHDFRIDILALFQTGLNMRDEPFLESLLDNCEGFQNEVLARLAELPESRLSQRMIARVLPHITCTADGIQITLHEPYDDSLARDGIGAKDNPERRMQIMLRYVSPQVWSAHLGLTYPELIAAAEKCAYPLFPIWMTAIRRARDATFAELLLPVVLNQPDMPVQDCTWMVRILSSEEKQHLARQWVAGHRDWFKPGYPAAVFLRELAEPWSVELTRDVIHGIRDSLATSHHAITSPAGRELLLDIMPYIATECRDELVQTLESMMVDVKEWREICEEIYIFFDFRINMISAIIEGD
jgi:hypothetical protein